MNNLARVLLLVGGLILALLVGMLIGRGQRAAPIAAEGNAAPSVQITTAPPPIAPEPTPLPPTIQAAPPPPVVTAPPRIAPDLQVQEDAAAVGMTTREEDAAASSGAVDAQDSQAQPAG